MLHPCPSRWDGDGVSQQLLRPAQGKWAGLAVQVLMQAPRMFLSPSSSRESELGLVGILCSALVQGCQNSGINAFNRRINHNNMWKSRTWVSMSVANEGFNYPDSPTSGLVLLGSGYHFGEREFLSALREEFCSLSEVLRNWEAVNKV